MSQEFKGFIARLTTKTGTGKRGKWTLYSVKIEKRDGTEYDEWVSLGFEDPGVKEGDYIVVQANQENGRWKADIKTLQKSKNPPARANKGQSSDQSEATPSSSTGSGSASTGFNRQTNPEDAKRMTYQSSRAQALELVRLLVEVKGLPYTKADTKAAEAKRFDEINAAVDKLTVRFYNDALSLRLLETVADTVPDKAPDGDLPDRGDDEPVDTSDEPNDSPDEDDEGFDK